MANIEEAPPGDFKAGEKIFKTKCAQFHTVEKGAGHKQVLVPLGMDEEIVLRKSEKKKHKRNKEREALSSSQGEKKHKKNKEKESLSSLSDAGGEKKVRGFGEKECVSDIDGREESAKHKNNKDKGKFKESSDLECVNSSDQASFKGKKHSIISNQELEQGKDHIDVRGEENVEHVKKGKGKKDKRKNENGDDFGVSCIEKSGGEAQSGFYSSKKRHRGDEVVDVEIGEGKKKKKKKSTKLDANIENAKASIADVETENNFESMNEYLTNSDSEKSSKRVKFASHVEVFPSSDDKDGPEETPEMKLVRGKRFTKEEDQIIKDAVYNYIEAHKLGEAGLDMVLNSGRGHLQYCWKEIGLALPYRPWKAVYHRGHTLFTRAASRRWTEDEKAFVLKYYEKHGPAWKGMAVILGKNRYAVHDTWRRICREGVNKGKWSQTEYQSLFNLVNKDLRMRVYEEKYTKHGMIRDNICWSAIGDCLTTRTDMSCCNKWYGQLSSSMVKENKWADTDDYRLLNELFRLDACCIEDVDWDNLLEHRSGDISLQRWRQMVNHIGHHGLQSFAEQVEVLAKRYCPELLDVRETLDS